MNSTISTILPKNFFFFGGSRLALPNWQCQDSFAWPIAFVAEEQVAQWAMHGDHAPLPCHCVEQLGYHVNLVQAKAGAVPNTETLLFSCHSLCSWTFFVGTLVHNTCR